jgi:hypothetical protein
MPEEKSPPAFESEPYVGKVYCSFCGGYDRKDKRSRDVMPFVFRGGEIPEGKVVVVCPNCFLDVFETILGRRARPIDADACAFDWSGAFRV